MWYRRYEQNPSHMKIGDIWGTVMQLCLELGCDMKRNFKGAIVEALKEDMSGTSSVK